MTAVAAEPGMDGLPAFNRVSIARLGRFLALLLDDERGGDELDEAGVVLALAAQRAFPLTPATAAARQSREPEDTDRPG